MFLMNRLDKVGFIGAENFLPSRECSTVQKYPSAWKTLKYSRIEVCTTSNPCFTNETNTTLCFTIWRYDLDTQFYFHYKPEKSGGIKIKLMLCYSSVN